MAEPEGGANDEERGHIAVPFEHQERAPRHGSPFSLEAHSMKACSAVVALTLLLTSCSKTVTAPLREKMGRDLEGGKLRPDAQGVVQLPSDLARGSIDERAFVTTNGTGSRWLLLRAWRGKGANLQGYLYAPGKPLKAGTDVSVATEDAGVIAVLEVTVRKTLNGSWYEVYRGID
jgi:hypothetical protein